MTTRKTIVAPVPGGELWARKEKLATDAAELIKALVESEVEVGEELTARAKAWLEAYEQLRTLKS